MIKVYPFGTVELKDPKNGNEFKVNRHRVKQYFDGNNKEKAMDAMLLHDSND